MPLVTAYYRPATLGEALDLLRSPQRVALAGGTTINADREPSDLEAVDLQSLGLDAIITTDDGERVRLGATATLDSVRRCDLLPDSLRGLARAEQPSTLRTLATVGGLVARAPGESLLLAALLAHDARVETATPTTNARVEADTPTTNTRVEAATPTTNTRVEADTPTTNTRVEADTPTTNTRVEADTPTTNTRVEADTPTAGAGQSERSLAELMAAGLPSGSLITAVTVDPFGRTAAARTGRTPADVPIVAAYGRRAAGSVALALSGVADHPVLVDVHDPAAGLDPVGDFRGSRQYRLHLVRTLAARVMEELR